jgi:AraC family transcriptional regulator of adaptative response/methylated-DNA-[protein]-cysteine methyltransferase
MPLDESAEQSRQYALVARAIAFIRGHATQQPSLEEIAAAVLSSANSCGAW